MGSNLGTFEDADVYPFRELPAYRRRRAGGKNVYLYPQPEAYGRVAAVCIGESIDLDEIKMGWTQIQAGSRDSYKGSAAGLVGGDLVTDAVSIEKRVYDLGCARSTDSASRMLFESEINDLVARHPCRSLCRAVVTELIACLRPTVKRCLTILPIDTSKALLNSSHSTEVPQWVLEDIITTTLQVPLPGGNQTFNDIISVILSAGGVPVTSALMLVAERLLRTVYRGSHEGVRGLVYLLANIQQKLLPMLIDCCPVIYKDDIPVRYLLIAAVMALQDPRLSSSTREYPLEVPGSLSLAAMWLEWSKTMMDGDASITNEDLPPLAIATLLYRLSTCASEVDEHAVVCLVSGRGFSLRMLPHIALLIPKLSSKGTEMLAFAMAAHLGSHTEISKHAAVKVIPDVYIDKLLDGLVECHMEDSYIQLLEAYTTE
ncbi:hypothetical protein Pmar_PMAR021597 [Perkinsus marinus ATCC 50983]|uniref:Uncharacterized protein n=1 Tax=Perkinsus marinus (strain ATCC 50983 / TXsc) TaxID=423536 RepID=C5L8L0_PERM5|nr:hypothetical protein Pmar_PMAR021597 [Perkinsus marinus ATCC 50983]EER06923.1 hypothetical protein Pmar_PMAR021597 [Perkinsus marinus ATCC 50983]|eukprot:XP_002775107.1 hypothetical protein Pmar_PMAR021597 [Perkinsus marinus ATCC 50983]